MQVGRVGKCVTILKMFQVRTHLVLDRNPSTAVGAD